MKEFIADRFRERRAEYRNRGREDEARLVAAAGKPDRVEQHPRAIEVDAIALVEIKFRFSRNNGRQMKDHIWTFRDQLFGLAGQCEVAGQDLDRKADFLRLLRRHHVVERHFADGVLAEPAVVDEAINQFAADHAGRAQNQNVQKPTPSLSALFAGVIARSEATKRSSTISFSGLLRYPSQ